MAGMQKKGLWIFVLSLWLPLSAQADFKRSESRQLPLDFSCRKVIDRLAGHIGYSPSDQFQLSIIEADLNRKAQLAKARELIQLGGNLNAFNDAVIKRLNWTRRLVLIHILDEMVEANSHAGIRPKEIQTEIIPSFSREQLLQRERAVVQNLKLDIPAEWAELQTLIRKTEAFLDRDFSEIEKTIATYLNDAYFTHSRELREIFRSFRWKDLPSEILASLKPER